MRLPPPESVADAFLALAVPECTRNGEVVIASAFRIQGQPVRGGSRFGIFF
jgi:hypothetical protein